MKRNALPPIHDKNMLIYNSMKVEQTTDYRDNTLPYQANSNNCVKTLSLFEFVNNKVSEITAKILCVLSLTVQEEIRKSGPVKSLDFIIRRTSNSKSKLKSKVVKYGNMEKMNIDNQEVKESETDGGKRRSQNYEIKELIKYHIAKDEGGLTNNILRQFPGYSTTNGQKVIINLNGTNGNASYVSSSHSKFICLNSTFEDEDAVFNAIVSSKVHHIKKKNDCLREEQNNLKHIKTIDEESLKEGYYEEIKSAQHVIENVEGDYETRKVDNQLDETIEFDLNTKFENVYVELVNYLRTSCISTDLRKEVKEKEREAFKMKQKQSITLCCCRESKIVPLQSKDIEDKETLFCFAKIPYDGHSSNNPDFNKLKALYYCYMTLTGEEINNIDWTKIGFQNQSDPSSDFRGVGMLGIIQMVYLIKNYLSLSKQIFHNAQEVNIKFRYPMYCAGLALTKLILDRLRDSTIDKLFSEDDSIITIANQIYVKLFKKFDEIWTKECCTIRDFQRVMQEVSKFSKKIK